MKNAQRPSLAVRRGHRREPKPPKVYLSDWILARTQPGRERWAALNVRRQGHQTFLPQIQHEGWPKVEMLFPGYLFVLSIGHQWYYLRATPGVTSIIMEGESPSRVPVSVMRTLQAGTDAEGIVLIRKPPEPPIERFERGALVKIKQGPFAGQIGVYISGAGPERVRVLLSMLGGKHKLDFGAREITTAAQAGLEAQREVCAEADAPSSAAPIPKAKRGR